MPTTHFLSAAAMVLGVSAASAACLAPPGDINATGSTDVTDVQCAVVAVLAGLTGDDLPACAAYGPLSADVNCDLAGTVADVQIIVGHALGVALSPTIDADGNGCVDACDEGLGPVGDAVVSGQLQRNHVVTLAFVGPAHDEADASPNPFFDYRLRVQITAPSGKVVWVAGYFAGGDTATGGDQWAARFRPDEVGTWAYQAEFRAGPAVAVALEAEAGSAMAPDGASGTIPVSETDAVAPDFRATGRLIYTGEHYLRTEDGAVWIKGGADSPENFLGYAGFDNTVNQPGGTNTSGLTNGIHEYAPHIGDWNPGDPDWGDGAGRGIIGALNYLASVGVNSIYFLPCNLGGDGRDTYPYIDPQGDRFHFDLSKLDQWEIVFRHAQTLGIALHFVLSETESGNENLHDSGTLGPERKLFYREMAARFGHHLGVFWNIGEENDYGSAKQIEFATYLRAVDAYDSPTTVHTHNNQVGNQYNGLLGDLNFELTSIQLSPQNAGAYTEEWRTKSAAIGLPWVVMLDEIGPAGTGVTDSNAPQIREQTLWPALMSGSGGVEWYFGYHPLPLGGDVRCEDFRTRQAMWSYTRIAREFMLTLPVESMEPDDDLLTGTNGHVFHQPGAVYALYLPDGGSAALDLTSELGDWGLRWYDVTTGAWSDTYGLVGGAWVELGTPAFGGDVAAVLVAGETGPPPPDGGEPVEPDEPDEPDEPGGSGDFETSAVSITLMDADTDQPVAGFDPIESGDAISLGALSTSNLNIRANLDGAAGSVRFVLNSGALTQTENVAPYALAGDTNGDYKAWSPSLGPQTLVVTTYSQSGASGASGVPLSVAFDFVN